MKTLAIAAGALLAVAATAASAQYGRPYTPRAYLGQECWNPRAGHYESVRPGPLQGDLDFSNCRPLGGQGYEGEALQPPPVYANPNEYGPRYAPGYGYYAQGVPPVGYECWNPHAHHYESVRPGPPQGDLDFSNCRPMGYR
jgi:hypothetical protein